MTTALPDGVRGIVLGISVEYLKKARGTLTAETVVEVPEAPAQTELEDHAEIRDAVAVVARVTVRWRLDPVPPALAVIDTDSSSRPT